MGNIKYQFFTQVYFYLYIFYHFFYFFKIKILAEPYTCHDLRMIFYQKAIDIEDNIEIAECIKAMKEEDADESSMNKKDDKSAKGKAPDKSKPAPQKSKK